MPDHPPPRHDLDAVGVAGAALCCLFWAGNAVAVKAAVPDLPPLGCAGLRFLLSLPIIVIVCRLMRHPMRVSRGLWGLVAIHGALTVLQIGTFNLGTSLGLAGRSTVFINVYPLIVAPLAWVLLGERMGERGWIGLGAAAVGVVILLTDPLRHGGGSVVADLIVLVSGIIFAAQIILQKKTFPLIPPGTLMLAQTVVATPLALAASLMVEGWRSFHFHQASILGVMYQGMVVSGLCFTAWILLLRRYPAGRLATLAFMTPLFGITLGHLIRGEPLTVTLLGGGGLVGCGIYLVASDRPSRPVARTTTTAVALSGSRQP